VSWSADLAILHTPPLVSACAHRRGRAGNHTLLSSQKKKKKMIRLRSIAWLALLATLFSAASPTLAAVLLAGKPAALGQMLGLPAASSESTGAGSHDAHAEHGIGHSEDAGDAHHDGSHQSHGIYCSLCLNPSSLATLAPLPPALWMLGLEFDIVRPEPYRAPSAPFSPLYRSRAPPATA
jgi:hypothetical protein